MTMNKGTYKRLIKLLIEVNTLASDAMAELDEETRWEYESGKHTKVNVHPNSKAPDSASQVGGSVTTGALRRRSMDLTRLLAEMRKSSWELSQ